MTRRWLRTAGRLARQAWAQACRHPALVMATMAATTLAVAFWLSRLESPEPSFLLRDRQGRFLGEVAREEGGEFDYWPLDEVPARVAAATIAIEDRRFGSHPGVDPLAVVRALRDNVRAGRRVSGASTLAMQVVRMQHPSPRGYARKVLEAASAFLILGPSPGAPGRRRRGVGRKPAVSGSGRSTPGGPAPRRRSA